MLGPLLVLLLGAGLYAAAQRFVPATTKPVASLVLAAFALRIFLSLFLREVPLFSYGAGGDCTGYEIEAQIIARDWSLDGVHYVTEDELPDIGRTSFPPNLFATVAYINGGDTSRLGCTAIIAFLACLSCLNIFTLALESGAATRTAQIVLGTLLFLPSFLYYTSDMFKDGIVVFCVVGVAGSALRLSRRFALKHLALAIACLVVLALTRYYLVYVTLVPLGLGLLGMGSRSAVRVFVSVVCFGVLMLAAWSRESSDLINDAVDDANTAYESGTSQGSLAANAQGGSGVDLANSSSAAFPLALLYTLFAPFFWQGGSAGLQLAKIDALVWYAIAYYALRKARQLWKARRSDLLILLSFIVPTTFAYAAAFSNVGLTVRERLGVVMMCALLSAMGVGEPAAEKEVVLAGPDALLVRRLGRT